MAFVVRIGLAIYSPSIEHPDEIFQALEPAHRVAYGYGVVTWEWREGIRSWVLPTLLAGIMRATAWTGIGSTGYTRGIAVVLSLISLTTVWFSYAWTERCAGRCVGIAAGYISAVWYQLVYFAPKAFSEVIAAHALLAGLYLGSFPNKTHETLRLFFAGLLCSLAACLRIQLLPAILVALIYFCNSRWRHNIPRIAAGIAVPIIAFGIVDATTWSYPFQTFIRYIWANLIEGRSSSFGVEPCYWYATLLLVQLGPMLFFAIAGIPRSHFLSLIVFVIVITHSLIAHKEARFVYPILPMLVTLGTLGMADILRATGAMLLRTRHLDVKNVAIVTVIVGCATSALLSSRFGLWTTRSGGLLAMQQLSRTADVCAVGLYEIPWFRTGGYAYLHRNIPIFLISRRDPERTFGSFNTMLAYDTFGSALHGFPQRGCWNGVCVYQRSGSCAQDSEQRDINATLIRTGD